MNEFSGVALDDIEAALEEVREICKAFLLVNSFWYPRARERLYEMMMYRYWPGKTFATNPTIFPRLVGANGMMVGSLVRRLELYISDLTPQLVNQLTFILSCCPNLTHFVLHVTSGQHGDILLILRVVTQISGPRLKQFDCFLPLSLTMAPTAMMDMVPNLTTLTMTTALFPYRPRMNYPIRHFDIIPSHARNLQFNSLLLYLEHKQ